MPTRRFRSRFRASDSLRNRYAEYSRRDSIPTYTKERRVLNLCGHKIKRVCHKFMSHPLFSSHSSHRFPQFFYLLKSPQISQIPTDFLPFKVLTRISQIPTDFLPLKVTQISQMTQIFYFFTFLPLNSSFTFKSPPGGPSPQNMARALMPRQP